MSPHCCHASTPSWNADWSQTPLLRLRDTRRRHRRRQSRPDSQLSPGIPLRGEASTPVALTKKRPDLSTRQSLQVSASYASFLPQLVTEAALNASAVEQLLSDLDLIMTKSGMQECDPRHNRRFSG